MRINELGLALIKEFESCRLNAYDDGGGVWTIGWGHIRGVKRGDTCSQGEADEWLLEDIEAHDISPLVEDVPTSPNEFAAMSSLAFNIGLSGFTRSTVLKRHRLGNHLGAARAFALWNKDNGEIVRGLVRRRQAEAALYLTHDLTHERPVEAPPAVETPKPTIATPEAVSPPGGCLMALFGMIKR